MLHWENSQLSHDPVIIPKGRAQHFCNCAFVSNRQAHYCEKMSLCDCPGDGFPTWNKVGLCRLCGPCVNFLLLKWWGLLSCQKHPDSFPLQQLLVLNCGDTPPFELGHLGCWVPEVLQLDRQHSCLQIQRRNGSWQHQDNPIHDCQILAHVLSGTHEE